MAVATYNLFTSGSATYGQKLHKKIQGNLLKGFQTKSEEWAWAKQLKEFDVDFSAREVSAPVDITGSPMGGFIAEGGYESNPYTAAPQELTFTWSNYNARFSFTVTSKLIDQKARQSQIIRQLKYQTMKLTEGMAKRVGISFYGVTSGILADTSTNATNATQTIVLEDAFGIAGNDNAAYLDSLFAVGDRIALLTGGALIDTTNSFGEITAKTPATPSLTVTMSGSCDVDANDNIVLANSVGNTLIGDTEYNLAPHGLIDMVSTASVHGLSSASYANWDSALDDTSGGRFTAVRLMYAQHEIANKGGGKADTLVVDQGVLRDMYAQERAALRFGSPDELDFSGGLKAKGFKILSTRKCPPGYAFVLDSDSMKRWTLVDMPGEDGPPVPGYGDESIDKLEDRNAFVYSFDFPYSWVCTNRANIAGFSGLTTATA
jgi:hypothetical protein